MSRPTLTIPSTLVAPRSRDASLTAAQLLILWEIAEHLDAKRIPAQTDKAIWIKIPSGLLRGPRPNNVRLRRDLERLAGIAIAGTACNTASEAVILSAWRIEGGFVHLHIPAEAVQMLRESKTFTKIDRDDIRQLGGYARRLFVMISDRLRQRQPCWSFDLDELKTFLGAEDKYRTWDAFRNWVLKPAMAAINAAGVIQLTLTPERCGRSIAAVRFEWLQAEVPAQIEQPAETEAPPATVPEWTTRFEDIIQEIPEDKRQKPCEDKDPPVLQLPTGIDLTALIVAASAWFWNDLTQEEQFSWRENTWAVCHVAASGRFNEGETRIMAAYLLAHNKQRPPACTNGHTATALHHYA